MKKYEFEKCINRLDDLVQDRESFLSNDEDSNKVFRTDIHYLKMAINILKHLQDDEYKVYSVRTPEKTPFIAKTNDPEVIEKINKLFIKIGGWENVKFLFENLRLNEES